MKINWQRVLGYILYAVGIVGGVESFLVGGSKGRGMAVVAMGAIIIGAILLECKKPKRR